LHPDAANPVRAGHASVSAANNVLARRCPNETAWLLRISEV
jgi:hypothetical protein